MSLYYVIINSDPTQPYKYLSAVVALRLTDPVSEHFMERYVEFYGSTRVPGTCPSPKFHRHQNVVQLTDVTPSASGTAEEGAPENLGGFRPTAGVRPIQHTKSTRRSACSFRCRPLLGSPIVAVVQPAQPRSRHDLTPVR
jgi:hypothetical protein